ILEEFGNDPRQIVDFARSAHPGDFGRYAPRVVQMAARGDPTALRLMQEAAAQVDEALDAVARLTGGSGRLCLLGGLAQVYPFYLAERHRARLSEPLADALTGAVALAVQTFQNAEAAR
ncbi:MAG TPA: N-acetylglucosamine kinase, partial [Pseudorhizobium sp.]|nr:N-acetylglucosamine kinase [Pseudorhizobium sp.]